MTGEPIARHSHLAYVAQTRNPRSQSSIRVRCGVSRHNDSFLWNHWIIRIHFILLYKYGRLMKIVGGQLKRVERDALNPSAKYSWWVRAYA